MSLIFHISDNPAIARFEPRPAPSPGQEGKMVWGVDEEHVHNYLLPRDCPRVCFRAVEGTTPEDREQLFSAGESARAVVAVESRWLEVLRTGRLYRYLLPSESFSCIDAGAGYHISREAVVPERVEAIDDILLALVERDVELRVVPTLWPLRDRVAGSTAEFSIIRMRNAQPPRNGYVPRWPM